MKYRKYILIMLLVVFIGLNRVHATESEDCYYLNDNFKAHLRINYVDNIRATSYSNYVAGTTNAEVWVDFNNGTYEHDSERLINWDRNNCQNLDCSMKTKGGHKFNYLYDYNYYSYQQGSTFTSPFTCPKYLVFQDKSSYKVWGTNDLTEAQDAVNLINSKGAVGAFASGYANGNKITADDYYGTFIEPNFGGKDICDTNVTDPSSPYYCEAEKVCKAIFGDVNDAGETKVDANGNSIDENGNGMIDPPSVAYLINSVLKYIRVIVPILIIILGSVDLAKAVMAGKPDEMKKAQTTFFKRLIAGVIVFFVPVIVNLVMYLADIAWDGMGLSHCNLP